MAYFAKLDDENRVIRVACVDNRRITDADGVERDQMGIDFLKNRHGGGTWVQCSYNTRGGVHYGQDGQPDGGKPLRGNYCGAGWLYHPLPLDLFSLPKPFPSWILDEGNGYWNAPVTLPDSADPRKHYEWNEEKAEWEVSGE